MLDLRRLELPVVIKMLSVFAIIHIHIWVRCLKTMSCISGHFVDVSHSVGDIGDEQLNKCPEWLKPETTEVKQEA